MAVCLSHGGTSTFHSNAPSTELLVGTVDGIFSVCEDNHGIWRVAKRGLEGLNIHAILIERQSGWIFAGAEKGSIFASRDNCQSWERREQGLIQKDVYCLSAVQLDDGVKLYAGTEPAYLYESDNLGETWKDVSSLRSVPGVSKWTFPAPPHLAHVKNIAFDLDPKTMYVCLEQGGLLKSNDGGLTWEEMHGFDEDISFELPEGAFPDDVHRFAMSALHPECFYLSGGAGLCRSRDKGLTWQHLTTPQMRIGYPDALLVHPRKDGLLFTAGARSNPRTWRSSHDADSAIARSRDGGDSWEILTGGLPGHIRGNIEAMTMELCGDSYSLFAGTTDGDIFYSEDEGDNWCRICEGLPAISKGGHYLRLR